MATRKWKSYLAVQKNGKTVTLHATTLAEARDLMEYANELDRRLGTPRELVKVKA